MMPLRDWPARRIGRLWLAGCAVELLLFAGIMMAGEPPPPELREKRDALAAADSVGWLDTPAALEQAGFGMDREPLPSGDTLVRISRDSSFVVASVRGGRIEVVEASPDVEQAIGTITTAWAAAMDGLVRLLLLMAAVLLPVPILLTVTTLTWAVQRRLPRR